VTPLIEIRHADDLAPGSPKECGLLDVSVGGLVCTTVELSHASEAGAVFKMTSLYFECTTRETPGVQNLDDHQARCAGRSNVHRTPEPA